MLTTWLLGDAEPFNGVRVLDNTARLLVILAGVTLAMLCLRFAYVEWRKGEGERFRVAGILSYGCCVLTPPLIALTRFGQPFLWWPFAVYIIGLVLGGLALWSNYTIAPTWWRISLLHRRRTTEGEEPGP